MRVVGVPGTWGSRGGWWSDESEFWDYTAQYGLEPTRINGHPFEWQTNLGSSLFFWRRWGMGSGVVGTWRFAGKSLGYYLSEIPKSERVVLAHSHGGQLAFHAAADGWIIDRLITVGTPVRADLEEVIAAARPQIRRWWHVIDLDHDYVAWWGSFGDGRVGNRRSFDQCDQTFRIAGIGHSGLLEDPALFHHWHKMGLIDFMKGGA